MMNPGNVDLGAIMRLKGIKDQLEKSHPKFAAFLRAVMAQPPQEGSVIEITVTRPDGSRIVSNMRIKAEDIQAIQDLQSLAGNR